MTFQEALKVLINGEGKLYEAVQVVEVEVLEASKYGDPDSSLQDWISAGEYRPTDTAESIAAEWDADRE